MKYFFVKHVNDLIFHLRINLFIFLFKFVRGNGFYNKSLNQIIIGVKNDGYCKIPSFFSSSTIENILNEINKNISKYKLNDHGYPVSDDNILKKIDPKQVKHNVLPGELKLNMLEFISNDINFFSKNTFFFLINIILKGKLKFPTLQYHVVSDGSENLALIQGKSEKRIAGNWHIDSKYRHVIKGIIFLDDVDKNTGGQTQIIVKSKKKLIGKDEIFVNKFVEGKDSQLSDEELINQGLMTKTEDKVSLYGKKGDLFFLDTSNLHRGIAINSKYRRLLWIY